MAVAVGNLIHNCQCIYKNKFIFCGCVLKKNEKNVFLCIFGNTYNNHRPQWSYKSGRSIHACQMDAVPFLLLPRQLLLSCFSLEHSFNTFIKPQIWVKTNFSDFSSHTLTLCHNCIKSFLLRECVCVLEKVLNQFGTLFHTYAVERSLKMPKQCAIYFKFQFNKC